MPIFPLHARTLSDWDLCSSHASCHTWSVVNPHMQLLCLAFLKPHLKRTLKKPYNEKTWGSLVTCEEQVHPRQGSYTGYGDSLTGSSCRLLEDVSALPPMQDFSFLSSPSASFLEDQFSPTSAHSLLQVFRNFLPCRPTLLWRFSPASLRLDLLQFLEG